MVEPYKYLPSNQNFYIFLLSFCLTAVEEMPIGDAQVLIMLSPLWSALAAYFVLGEPWLIPEFFAVESLPFRNELW